MSTGEPIPARRRERSVPGDLETILIKCLQRNPERRYPSAAELRDDLERFLADRPIRARRPGPAVRASRFIRRHRVTTAAALGAALLVAGGAVILARPSVARRQLERILDVLAQASATRLPPEQLTDDWGTLAPRLAEEIQRAPYGEISMAAHRAASGCEVRLPAFGLVSDPPRLEVRFLAGFDLPGARRRVVLVEGAWDNGDWSLLAGATEGLFITGGPIGKLLPGVVLTPGPHRLSLRRRLRLYDLPPPNTTKSFDGPFEQALPELAGRPPVREETLALPPSFINLYDVFPADFPRRDPAAVPAFGPDGWFQGKRIRVLWMDVPPGPGKCLEFAWPGEPPKTICSELPEAGSRCGEVQIVARIAPPVALAADVEVALEREAAPLLHFDFAFESGSTPFAPRKTSQVTDDAGALRQLDLALPAPDSVRGRVLAAARSSAPLRARLVFHPSREVALASRSFDHYLGDELAVVLPLEFTEVTATRKN